MKHQLSKIISFLIVLFFVFAPIFALAQPSTVTNPTSGGSSGSSTYEPITPGYQSFFNKGTDFAGMLTRIFEVSIMLTIILSIIMIIWGGVEYMGSESVYSKGAGKERIYAALSGLLIALISILLISTLVPGGNGTEFTIDIFGTR